MRPAILRSALAAALSAALVMTAAACQPKSEGIVQVLVIGETPKVADPQRGPLAADDAVLVNNVAQGLLRFDANGQVEPGLAETWNVSDDGLSYIFRLANGAWPNGKKITAEQVARMLRRLIASSSRNPLKDNFGAVDEIVAMTDRVIEIRLNQPRPHLLQLLAQPEMGLVLEGQGTGPFAIDRSKSNESTLRLSREIETPDEEILDRERLGLGGATAEQAIRAFAAGKADLVLGGTFVDLPLAQAAQIRRRALQFDPASGLFGLIPVRKDGLLATPEARQLLSAAIDRDALVAAFNVPGLVPRATVLEAGIENIPTPAPPQWSLTPLADRRPALVAQAARIFTSEDPLVIKVALPEGRGSKIILDRLTQDWGAIGLRVERTNKGEQADLRLVDEVAASSSASWFLRHFRCDNAAICDEEADKLLQGARDTPVLAQRSALLVQASQRMDSQTLFMPLAAPIRWSLVTPRITGFAGNRFAIHTLTGLEDQLNRTGE
ncbi:MAG TPA: ABC transporter substrate-binding protein [Sphingomicrobium sp.]|nr:ABC transporter substrate-binding protein [Sphingomicrobium sp.]